MIKKIGMAKTTNVKRRYQIHFTQKMLEEIDMKIEDIKNDRFLNVVDWFSFLISIKKITIIFRDKVKQFNCIDEYNKYIHQIEDQIKSEQQENQKREENLRAQGLDDGKRDLEMRYKFVLPPSYSF